jgi:hypothetical protein
MANDNGNGRPLSGKIGLIAMCGAVSILALFAVMDFYAITQCFALARMGNAHLMDFCTADQLFRTTLEIGGMALGLYGASKLIR